MGGFVRRPAPDSRMLAGPDSAQRIELYELRLNGNATVIPSLRGIRGRAYGSLTEFGMTGATVQADCVLVSRVRPPNALFGRSEGGSIKRI